MKPKDYSEAFKKIFWFINFDNFLIDNEAKENEITLSLIKYILDNIKNSDYSNKVNLKELKDSIKNIVKCLTFFSTYDNNVQYVTKLNLLFYNLIDKVSSAFYDMSFANEIIKKCTQEILLKSKYTFY